MIRSFRSDALRLFWEKGSALKYKTVSAEVVLDALTVINGADEPRDAAFTGFRFDEWIENNEERYGVMLSEHWLVSFGWSDGHAVDVDLERIA
jgi:toxin HigB-1